MEVEHLLDSPENRTAYRENTVRDVSALAPGGGQHTPDVLFFIYLTCRRPGRIQIVRNHCLLWKYRRCRLGAVVAAARQRRFQTVENRFVVGCRPFLMRAIRPLTKKILIVTRLNIC